VQSLGDSRQVDEERLRQLRKEERDIYKALDGDQETLKSKIIRLAEIIEERINLADTMLPKDLTVNQISSNISRTLRSLQMPFAHWVSEYLPEKYKNPNIHKHNKLIITLKELLDQSVEPTERIEQCSNMQLETLVSYIKRAKDMSDDVGTLLNHRLEAAQQEAIARGMGEIGGDKIRDSISARDYRYEIPESATLDELNHEVITQGERVREAYRVFLYDKYWPYRAGTEAKARQYGNSFRVYANMIEIINEEKWSGEGDFWFDRNYWKKVQSAHKSGNSTFFPTTLCAHCSADIDNDPKDFHVMKYDSSSPTGFRCDNCKGIEVLDRFNSREQVGDKSPEVDRLASEICNHIVHYVEIFQDVRKYSMNPAIYARKRAISQPFREAAFGKDRLVVPRKKTTAAAAKA